jgi:hypothetical protein
MIWTAGFRTAVISPYEQIQLTEPRGFADQTVRQVLHMAGGGERLRVRLTNRYGRTPLTIAAATAATEQSQAAAPTFDALRSSPSRREKRPPVTRWICPSPPAPTYSSASISLRRQAWPPMRQRRMSRWLLPWAMRRVV